MSELKKRPRIQAIQFEVEEAGRTKKKKGADLNDVLRGVLVDLREAWSIPTKTLGKRLGLSQQTISKFLDADRPQGTRLDTLSKICAALNSGPGEVLSMHPDYEAEPGADSRWTLLKNSLPEKSLDQLVETIVLGANLDLMPTIIENQHIMVKRLVSSKDLKEASNGD